MMRKINFMLGMGLGKNHIGPPEFVERKVLILKYGVGYQGADDFKEEEETKFKPRKKK